MKCGCEKGFTLIELVGVIVLVSLMILIIIPTVEKAVRVGQENADQQLKDNIILAAKSWAVDNKDRMPRDTGVKINIWLSDLQKDGYIERNIKLPSTGDSINEVCVEATNKSSNAAKKDVYDYVYNDNCMINLDLVIIGKVNGTPLTSGTWTNKDITLTATSSYTGTYQWYSGTSAINGAIKQSYVAARAVNTEGKVTYKVKMKAEKRNPEATYVAAIDKKVPSITVTTKIATKNNLTISLSETSSGSGLKGYAITNSATTPTSWTAISGTSYSNTFSKATGTYYIHVKDAVGNIAYKKVDIIAMDPPTCTITLSGTLGTNSWYKTNVGVTLNGSGTVSTKGLATTANSTNGVSSLTHSKDTSGVTYYGYVSNVAGSNSCSKSFKMDKTVPSISTVTKIATKNNLTFTIGDNLSGLSGYNITNSTATPTSWTAVSGKTYSTTVTKATGTYYIHVKDLAGNTTYKKVDIISMDPPTCTISLSGTVGTNSWYKTNVGVTLNGSGTVSTKGLATSANSTNGKTGVTHSTDTSGVTYYGYVSNVAGSNSCSKSFKMDKTVPSISTVTKIATKNNLTFTIGDNLSGLSGYNITNSTATPSSWTAVSGKTYSTTVTKTTGTYYIHVKDLAGNITYKSVSITSMDPPTCTISLSGTVGGNSWYKSNVGVTLNGSGTVSTKGLATTANSTNGVSSLTHSTDTSGVTYYGYVSNVAGSNSCFKTVKRDTSAPAISVTTKISQASNLTITLQDNLSGLSGYNITNSTATPSSWTTVSGVNYSTTVTKTTGTYYIHSKDAAGNTSYKSVYVQALVPPTCTLSTSGTVGNDSWYRGDVTVNMTTSGTVTTKGLATSANSTNGKTSVVHSSDGKSITYYGYVANDAGGNSCSKTFKRDATPPTLGYDLRRIYYGSDIGQAYHNQWTQNEIERKLYPADSMSGVDHTEYQSGGTWYTEGNVASWIIGNAVNNTNYRVIDKAGNVSSTLNLIMKSDWEAPQFVSKIQYTDYSITYGSFFGWKITENLSGIKRDTSQFEYCYEKSRTGCGGICSKGNIWSHRPSQINPWDNSYFNNADFKGTEEGAVTYDLKAGGSTNCIKNYNVWAHFRICDIAGNCNSRGSDLYVFT